jgi:shikimate kinase
MMSAKIIVRRPPSRVPLLFIVGPGGVGKSTLGRLLAPALGQVLVDLDDMFCDRIGPIHGYVRDVGAEAYREANSGLAAAIVAALAEPAIVVASSGFLAPDNAPSVLRANHDLIASGYSLSLLPALDEAEAMRIVVGRQLGRGFGLNRESEERKFRERMPHYREAGDMLVVAANVDDPAAAMVCAALNQEGAS